MTNQHARRLRTAAPPTARPAVGPRADTRPQGTPPTAWSAIRVALQDPLLRRAAVVMAGVVVAFAVVVLVAEITSDARNAFHPDAERRVAAGVSALALVGAGAVALSAGLRAGAGWQLVPVGLLLLFMAVDEWFTLHERLEAAAATDWQLLYLPVFAVAGACFFLAAGRHRTHAAFLAPWLAGAACWVVSQALELAQWNGDDRRAGYPAMMLPEEVLELTGTLLFLLAGLVLHRRQLELPSTPALAPR